VQNSAAVFQLNFSNNIGFCASISRRNAKPKNVACDFLGSLIIHNHQNNLAKIFK